MHTTLIQIIETMIRLDESEKEFISSLFTAKHYLKGEYFLQEGQVCKTVGFIEQGLIRYYSTGEMGDELIYDFGKENDFTCNYESFLDHSPSSKNIQCIEDSTILSMSYDNLQLLYEHVKEGQKFGRLACEQLYVQAIKKVTSLYTDQPEQRYLLFTATYPDLLQRIPQYYISSFVGVKPPSLSRIRKRLSSQ
ncbi:cAMP-binding domain of CRP or a regulatory subunit of cAMP-dependent protein kinases [Chitinophaga sp. CF118]|uniref:Crp/Fnr family transcriptional regulator n=1 Tax=Chitinophaga sp. CF118 TaxID=1884367 RepID=UPI0008E082D4|nr:Crp/Fnr family transcriptional regulator [Chitinophaga sp. CF118]SFD61011.1 cAMP-binding domain of CRP or a regulatory subunit of cAMP-dependent protein kinases [Chitinophaga sp. CF118]